jgi:D-alanyl-D-alanine carboxypeptidase/D-alanyl-D-alanine-endopeptidase (penicillin-binding protein 4)
MAAAVALRQGLEEALGADGERSGRWSVLAISLDRGDTLFARSPHETLAPASNMKLLTTAAALVYLGSDYRFSTFLLADGPIRNGVLEGDLYLYGTGDPTLGTRFAESPSPAILGLADSLAALGIREIRGAVVGDGSFFSGPGSGEGWDRDNLNAWYAAPAGALSVHENLVRVEVAPGAPGGPAQLSFVPGGDGVAVRNEAVTGGGGRIRVTRMDYGGPILISGGIGTGSSSHAVTVADAATYAAALFRDVLLERGFVVHGGVESTDGHAGSRLTGRTVFAPALEAETPPLRVLARHTSEPLQEILGVINHQSHNFYAEQVLRAVGRAAVGEGSAAGGEVAVKALLARAGVDTARVRILDGGGLSALNQVSAGTFVGLLSHMAGSPHAQAFMETLPVAGEVRRFRRMGGTPAAGNLRAKTGTIDSVSALSGYVTSANGERVAFSIIGNALPSVSRAKNIENTIGARLAAFDRSGPVADEVNGDAGGGADGAPGGSAGGSGDGAPGGS